MTLNIFTTGAYLRPLKIKDDSGKERWLWTVSEFIDDTFMDGKVFNPNEIADTLENLLQEEYNNECK
ncbi:MAG: hypothetical protein LBO72_02165 [Helicobacteraceae bacterium]|jgi:hypothetical protein|nr:hypothetical protein [Helicobacteraceae bacterium]